MKTAKERELAFREDLRNLLLKHNADFDIKTEGEYDYIEPVVEVYIPRERDPEGNVTAESCEFTLKKMENLVRAIR